MEPSRCTSEIPAARIDPSRCAAQALNVICATATTPPTHEILVLVLDECQRGISILMVHDTFVRDAVYEVSRIVARGAPVGVRASAVVASIRPGGRADASDINRWYACDALLAEAGVVLLEWFVISDRVDCPRSLASEPPRWPV
ncbi:MAG: hypothetical protein AAGA42_20710 [Actinomycetota bacterium]